MTVLRAKCLVVGDATVGKSAVTQSFFSDGAHFPKAYSMTTGVELLVKSVTVPDSPDTVELMLFDCAGHEVFGDLVMKYWDAPTFVVFVFDVTNPESLDSCLDWADRVKTATGSALPKGVLVANKIDLENRRLVDTASGKEQAARLGMEYFETSAKTGVGADTPFHYLADRLSKDYKDSVTVFEALP